MGNINQLVFESLEEIKLERDPTLTRNKGIGGKSSNKPEIKEGEYLVQMRDPLKQRLFNAKTGRMKKFKRVRWLKTNIPPEERTLRNKPKYTDGKPKVGFQAWLRIDSKKRHPNHSTESYGKAANGKWYGWSHRAIHGFYIGELIKPGIIGNKFEYGKEVDKKYNTIAQKEGFDVADKWRKETLGNFKPYTIKTDEEAMEHAIRFAKDVS